MDRCAVRDGDITCFATTASFASDGCAETYSRCTSTGNRCIQCAASRTSTSANGLSKNSRRIAISCGDRCAGIGDGHIAGTRAVACFATQFGTSTDSSTSSDGQTAFNRIAAIATGATNGLSEDAGGVFPQCDQGGAVGDIDVATGATSTPLASKHSTEIDAAASAGSHAQAHGGTTCSTAAANGLGENARGIAGTKRVDVITVGDNGDIVTIATSAA